MMVYTFADVPFREHGKAKFGVLGLASDLGSTTAGGGQSEAPRSIRLSYAVPTAPKSVIDLGDMVPPKRDNDDFLELVSSQVEYSLRNQVKHLLVLGGDDSVAFGVVKGAYKAEEGKKVNLVHLDAHDDRSPDTALGIDHANWVSHALPYVDDYRSLGVRAPGCEEKHLWTGGLVEGPTVVVVDMDVLDPVYAPGVAVPEPFGWTSTKLLLTLKEVFMSRDVKALVINEVLPSRDMNELTSRTAFRLGYEFVQHPTMIGKRLLKP